MLTELSLYESARWLSAFAFLFYGFACLFFKHFVNEFERYGLPQFRVLTALLEIAGGAGLLFGFSSQLLTFFSATGLAALMAGGVVVRFWIRDPLAQSLPALSLFFVNFYLAIRAFLV